MSEFEFKMTYYKGAGLAHGGILIVRSDVVLFSPGTIERALGAEETVIPYNTIKMVEVTGTLTESLLVRTQEKAHRFVGSNLYKIRDMIDSAMQKAYSSQPAPAPVAAPVAAPAPAQPQAAPAPKAAPAPSAKGEPSFSVQCSSCFKNLKSDFNFCPYCKNSVHKSCPKCFKGLEAGWVFCPSCSASV